MQAVEQLQQGILEHPWRAGLYAFTALIAVFAVVMAVDLVLRPTSFPVKRVSFEGEFNHVDEQALTAAVVERVRGNFLLVDLNAVRERAVQTPWVHRVTVRRVWPDGIHIVFTEQNLVARWGAQAWVNAQGEAVQLRGEAGPTGLPRLNGPEGMSARVLEHFQKLSALLVPVGLQITTLTLTPRHSWVIELNNKLTLTLGREEPEPKIERFARMYPAVAASQSRRIRKIDLRYANGFAVEWEGQAAVVPGAAITTGSIEG